MEQRAGYIMRDGKKYYAFKFEEGDKKDGKNVLIGEGELPVKDFMNALKSLNYDGYISVMENDDIRRLLTQSLCYDIPMTDVHLCKSTGT